MDDTELKTGARNSAEDAGRLQTIHDLSVQNGAACPDEKQWPQKSIDKRPDVTPADKEHAQSEYGDVNFADEKNKKYPIDTEEHIRAAWNYINKEGNAGKYDPDEVATIKGKIVAAWKDKIDKAGPPSAGKSFDDELVNYGAEIKALGDGRLGGYMVRFSTKTDPDLTHDYFTKETTLRYPMELPVFYNHGLDAKMGKQEIGSAKVTRVDEVGAWAETQLAIANEYAKAIYKMAEAGKLGYSTGSLPHLVEREPVGKGVTFVKSWYVGELSLTPAPAEPRNTVVSLKSLSNLDLAALPIEDKKGEFTMNEIEMAVKSALDARDAAAKAEADRKLEIKTAQDEAVKAAVEDLKKRGQLKGVPNYVPADHKGDDNDGVIAFRSWIKTGEINEGLIKPDNTWGREFETKTAFNITTGASGSYLVPDPLYQVIQAKRNLASFIRLTQAQHFITSADHILVPVEDTSHTAFTLTAESAAYTENEGTVAQVDMILLKYTKEVVTTEEFSAYEGTNFDAWLMTALGRAEGVTENTLAYTELAAHSTSMGTAMASQTAITPGELSRLVGSLPAGYNVPSECGFVTRNSTKWYLKALATGSGPFAFIPTPGGGDFFGYPCYVCDDVVAPASTIKSVWFANWTMFGIAERPGMMIQRNPYLLMANGQIALFASIFRSFKVLQAEAFMYATQAS